MAQEWFENLAGAVEEAFADDSVLFTRAVSGAFDAAAGAYVGGTTISATILVDRHAVQTRMRSIQAVSGGNAALDEVTLIVRKATVDATPLGTIKEGDTAVVAGTTRRVVRVEDEAVGAILRVVVRTERRL